MGKALNHKFIYEAGRNLTLKERRLALFIIRKADKGNMELDFCMPEYRGVYGIMEDDGKIFREVKDAIKRLRKRSARLDCGHARISVVRWIDRAELHELEGRVVIHLNWGLREYFMELGRDFPLYENVWYMMMMKNEHSAKLYEFFKRYLLDGRGFVRTFEEKCVIEVSPCTLEYICGEGCRKLWTVGAASREIDRLTDLSVKHRFEKKGVKLAKAVFEIAAKKPEWYAPWLRPPWEEGGSLKRAVERIIRRIGGGRTT